jgi:RNA polymerase sigma-70 factor, ECF subfamily
MIDEPAATQELLNRLRSGDGGALALLFDYYRPRLRQMVQFRMHGGLSARIDASDVLQETFVDAFQQLAGYLRRPRVAFYVWLRGLTWERLLKLQERHLGAQCRTVERELPLPESSILLARALLANKASPSQAVVQEELRRRVQQGLARLSAPDREVILMRDFEGLTNSEAAQILNLSASATTMRYGRALYRLKEILMADSALGESQR